MSQNFLSDLELRQLSERLLRLRQALPLRPPPGGWLKTIRRALGIRTSQLAARLDVAQPSVVRTEERESQGTISLQTLRKFADALDCDVVYYLVPRTSIMEAVGIRAAAVAIAETADVAQSLRLEWNAEPPPEPPEQLDQRVARLVSQRPARLWTTSIAMDPVMDPISVSPHQSTEDAEPTTVAPGNLTPTLGSRMQFLLPAHLRTLDDLLAWEQANILNAREWALTRTRADFLTVAFLIRLHRQMFEGIWRWAGQLRRTEHPDGARWPTIGIELNDLAGEARFWRERKLYSADDLAVRFHHRLMRIRPWEGGNGTHARLVADALAVSLDRPPFTWGRLSHYSSVELQKVYAESLADADAGDFRALVRFARGA